MADEKKLTRKTRKYTWSMRMQYTSPLDIPLSEMREVYVDRSGKYFKTKKMEKFSKELRERVLNNDEYVILCVESFKGVINKPELVITNQRIINYMRGFIGFKSDSIPFNGVASVAANRGILSGGIYIESRGGSAINFEDSNKQWSHKIKQLIEYLKSNLTSPETSNHSEILKSRLARGEITIQEYEQTKKVLDQ